MQNNAHTDPLLFCQESWLHIGQSAYRNQVKPVYIKVMPLSNLLSAEDRQDAEPLYVLWFDPLSDCFRAAIANHLSPGLTRTARQKIESQLAESNLDRRVPGFTIIGFH